VRDEAAHRAGVSLAPTRIGVLLCAPKINIVAARHLILSLNPEQRTFEFELLKPLSTGAVVPLCSAEAVDADYVDEIAERLPAEYDDMVTSLSSTFGLEEGPPSHYVVLSTVRMTNNYYAIREGRLSVIALGNWKRFMAPPSFLEFAQALVLREAVAAASPSLVSSGHLGTKGCLFDFNQHLDEVRHKILNGFVCRHCRNALAGDGLPELGDELEHLLGKGWMGRPTDPTTPAGVAFNLGYDLFITKGLRATPVEALRSGLQRAGAAQLATIVGGIILAALLVALGLKA